MAVGKGKRDTDRNKRERGDELARWLRGVSSGSSLGPSDFALGLGCLFPAARGAAQPRPTRTHHWIDCFASLHAQRCGQAPKGLVASGCGEDGNGPVVRASHSPSLPQIPAPAADLHRVQRVRLACPTRCRSSRSRSPRRTSSASRSNSGGGEVSRIESWTPQLGSVCPTTIV